MRRNWPKTPWSARAKALVTLDSISDGVISTDEGGRIEFVNAAAEKLLGVAGHELLGREFGAEMRIPRPSHAATDR